VIYLAHRELNRSKLDISLYKQANQVYPGLDNTATEYDELAGMHRKLAGMFSYQ
jgi:hypothetical protein